MLCALTGQCAHPTCLQLNMCRKFCTKGPTYNTGTKKPPGSRCGVTRGVKAESSELFGECEAGASPYLPLTGNTHVTDAFSSSQISQALILSSCDIQRNCISSLESLFMNFVPKEEILHRQEVRAPNRGFNSYGVEQQPVGLPACLSVSMFVCHILRYLA